LFLGKTWTEVYDGITAEGRLQYNMPSSNIVWTSYLKKLGYRKYLLSDACPDCYTVNDFAIDNPRGTFLLALDGHVVTVIDGLYYDTWDSGGETPIYYWRKE
jgi:hypothetical protein